MAQKAIREFDAKNMLARNWKAYFGEGFAFPGKVAQVAPETDLEKLAQDNPWLTTDKLVVKPDMIMGKRGKHGLILLDGDWNQAQAWLREKRGSDCTIGEVTGELTHFLIEPFNKGDKEYYAAVKSEREGDILYFSTVGGVDVEENWDKVVEWHIPITGGMESVDIASKLPTDLDPALKGQMVDFLKGMFKYYSELNYAFLEINPFVVKDGAMIPLDLKCRIDDTGHFESAKMWGDIKFPAPFGRKKSTEEAYINRLDSKTGASLKLTILNPKGRVWTMVAGGGASVIYTDTIADLGFAKELCNYGEYSGNPSTDETYEYARTVLDLMTREKAEGGAEKFLIIGGGIANFTDVAKTFTGILKALKEYKQKLIDTPVKIYVRRGGPNFEEGLRNFRNVGKELGIPVEVYGPETHMTRVVTMALGDGAGGA